MKGGLLGTLGRAVSSDQVNVREAALALLALLVQHPGVMTVAKQVKRAFYLRRCLLHTVPGHIKRWHVFGSVSAGAQHRIANALGSGHGSQCRWCLARLLFNVLLTARTDVPCSCK